MLVVWGIWGEECKVEAVVVLLGLKGEGGGNPQECSLCQLLGSVAWWCQSMLAAVPFSLSLECVLPAHVQRKTGRLLLSLSLLPLEASVLFMYGPSAIRTHHSNKVIPMDTQRPLLFRGVLH